MGLEKKLRSVDEPHNLDLRERVLSSIRIELLCNRRDLACPPPCSYDNERSDQEDANAEKNQYSGP